MSGLQLVMYFSIILFIVVIAFKMAKLARMPVHLRWDLYPIPHEKGKGEYGGSYFEEVDWWTRKREFSLLSELKEMGMEIVFIQSLFRNNRPLWFFSFPFHLGMYCLMGFTGILILGAILELAGVTVAAANAGVVGLIVHYLTVIFGTAGWILSIFGAFGLIFSRLINGELRKSSVLSDYTNLVFILVVTVSGLTTWLTVDPSYSSLRGFIGSLISFNAAGVIPASLTVQLWLTAALMLYFPFTHMTHFVGKYFTYHRIRWEDAPNIRGGKIESAVSNSLRQRIDWSAPHIKSGATWAEAATEETPKDE
jgi:nitrate reductase gamma subunit